MGGNEQMMDIKITDNIEACKQEIFDKLNLGMQAVANEVENNAKNLCPVDTGNLRNSITTEITDEGDDKVLYVGTNVEYGKYVEFDDNKSHQTGQAHFLRDSVATHLVEYKDKLESFMK
jgi:hypothetical protein